MDLATVDKLLTTTRSVRSRLNLTPPVDPAVIEECLEIAVQAPAGSSNCRYHFLVVTDPASGARWGTSIGRPSSSSSPPRAWSRADRTRRAR